MLGERQECTSPEAHMDIKAKRESDWGVRYVSFKDHKHASQITEPCCVKSKYYSNDETELSPQLLTAPSQTDPDVAKAARDTRNLVCYVSMNHANMAIPAALSAKSTPTVSDDDGSDSLDLTELNDLNVPDDIRGDKWESWYQEQNFEETASWYGDVSDGRSGLLLGLNNTTEENSVRMPGPDDVRVGCQRAPGEQLSEDTLHEGQDCISPNVDIEAQIRKEKFNVTNHVSLKELEYFEYIPAAVPCYVGDDASVALEASRGLLLTSPSQTDPDVAVDTRILVGLVSLKDTCMTSPAMPSKLSTPAVCDDASELEHTQMDPDDVVIRPMASDCGEDSVAKHTDRELDDSLYKSVQENPSPGIRQFALTDAVCMQLMPMPQELRKTMVTGQHVSREWLPHSLRSMTAVTTGMSVVCHVEDGDKDSDDEDSKERKRKAMDCLRRENEEKRLKQKPANLTKAFNSDSHCPRTSSDVGCSSLKASMQQNPSHDNMGKVLLSKVNHIFQEGSYVPLPSQEAMTKSIGRGGNGVVGFIYHGGREFAVKETYLHQEELETWSSVSHPNVITLCAVIEGDLDALCPGARICYQMMPRMTGDIKSMLEEREMPALCHYFYDFKEDSERAGLVLGNAKYILLSVLNGLKHLHSLGIMHRDIKLQNILVDRHCQCRDIFLCSHRGDTGYGVLISDFGSAQRVDRVRQKLNQLEACHRPIKYSVYGTPGYRPPETSFPMSCNEILFEWLSFSTDIWSFGTMVVKFFVGSRGPHSQKEMATLLLAGCLRSSAAVRRPRGMRTSTLLQTLAVEPNEMKKLQRVVLLEKYLPQAEDLYQLVQACLTVANSYNVVAAAVCTKKAQCLMLRHATCKRIRQVNWQQRSNVDDVMAMKFFKNAKDSSGRPVSSMSAGERVRGPGDFQTTSGKATRSNGGESQKQA